MPIPKRCRSDNDNGKPTKRRRLKKSGVTECDIHHTQDNTFQDEDEENTISEYEYECYTSECDSSE